MYSASIAHRRYAFDGLATRCRAVAAVIAARFAACVVAVLLAVAARADDAFPTRVIRVIVPYPAGGIVDLMTRVVAARLAEVWGQPIVIEDKPGANGNIAFEQAARAAPDGYTWVYAGPAMMANPRLYGGTLPWSEKSFAGVGVIAWAPATLVVHPDVAPDVAALVTRARRAPGELNVANVGVGSSTHLNTAIFLNGQRLAMTEIAYKGQPPAIHDLLANRIHVMVASVGLVADHVRSRALHGLAVIGPARSPLLPEVPTFAEAGYPEANLVPWYGLAAPAGIAPAIQARIVEAINRAVAEPTVRAQLARLGVEPAAPMDRDDIARRIAADTERYAGVIRASNIRLSD
ncbi:MAG: tripartite tricarboxylate transporter substrate binding protein [Proteobacteria bacterium]|nr:tripartite tricarboxylate transporter substrate binding protein [Pseudomonadota bacterium]